MTKETKVKVTKEQRQRRAVHRLAMGQLRLEMSRLASGPPLPEKLEILERMERAVADAKRACEEEIAEAVNN